MGKKAKAKLLKCSSCKRMVERAIFSKQQVSCGKQRVCNECLLCDIEPLVATGSKRSRDVITPTGDSPEPDNLQKPKMVVVDEPAQDGEEGDGEVESGGIKRGRDALTPTGESPVANAPQKPREMPRSGANELHVSNGDDSENASEIESGGLFQYFAAVDTRAGFRVVEILSSEGMTADDEPKGRTKYMFSDDVTKAVHVCDGKEIKLVDSFRVDDDPVYEIFDARAQSQNGFVIVRAISEYELDAQGRPIGSTTIVHEGSPGTEIIVNGRDPHPLDVPRLPLTAADITQAGGSVVSDESSANERSDNESEEGSPPKRVTRSNSLSASDTAPPPSPQGVKGKGHGCGGVHRIACIRANFPKPMSEDQAISRICVKCDKCKKVPKYMTCSDKFCSMHGERIENIVDHITNCHPIEQQQSLATAAKVGVCVVCGWAQEGFGVGHRQCAGHYGSKLHTGVKGATDADLIIHDLQKTPWANERTVRKACSEFDKIATKELVEADHYRCHKYPVLSSVYLDRIRAIELIIFQVINSEPSTDPKKKQSDESERRGASKMILMMPAMITFIDKDAVPLASGHVVNVLRLVSSRAIRLISGAFESLFHELVTVNARPKPLTQREAGSVIQEKVSRRKLKQARSTLAADAGGKELPKRVPTAQAMRFFEEQYNDERRRPLDDDQYEDGCAFRERQADSLSQIVTSLGDVIVGPKQVRAAMKKVNKDSISGPTGANGGAILMLYGSDEVLSEFAMWISRLCKTGVDGLNHADPVDVQIRDFIICRSVTAMTKPGKDTVRVIEPESTWAKVFGGSILTSVLAPMQQYFGPHQLAFKRPDGLISSAKLLQTLMEMSMSDVETFLDGGNNDFGSTIVAFLFDKKQMYPNTDRRELLDELIEQCSHNEYGAIFKQILCAFLFFFGNSFSVHHHHDVPDFSADQIDRYFTEYISNQGVGIGSVLSSLLAFLKQHFALLQVIKGQSTKAVYVSVADNSFIVGTANDVAKLLVRASLVDQAQRGVEWHEMELLRLVSSDYNNGTYNMMSNDGRRNIRSRIKTAFKQCVQQVSEGFVINSRLESVINSAPVRLFGTKFVGVYIGTPSYRKKHLELAFRDVEKEILQLQSYSSVTSQTKVVLFLKSIQHEFAHHLYSSVPSDIIWLARRLDTVSRAFIINQADLDPEVRVDVASITQRLIIHLPQGDLGFGVVSYEDRVKAGSFVKSVTGMLHLVSQLGCPWMQESIKLWMTVNSKVSSKPVDGTLNHGYRQVLDERKAFFASSAGDDGANSVHHAKLPLNPAELRIKGEAPSKQIYRDLLKEIHVKRVIDLKAQVKHVDFNSVDGRAIQAWELHCQVKKKRGYGLPLSVIPTLPCLIAKDDAYRRFITEVLGFAPFSLSESLLDRKCACYLKSTIDEYHCVSCPILGRSAVHDTVKLMIGREMGQARTSGTTVETEPRGSQCGRQDGDTKGPDLLLSHVGHSHFIDFKSINVVADKNREDADRDLRLARREDNDDVWSEGPGSQQQNNVTQASTKMSQSKLKRKRVHEICEDVAIDSDDAKFIRKLGSTVTAVPLTTTGVIHPNMYKILKEYIDKGDEFDDRYNFGWDCPDFRSYILQRASICAINAHGEHVLRSAKVVARKFDLPLPGSPTLLPPMIPTPFSANDYDVDSDDEDELSLINDDENVTSTGEDLYQKEFPVLGLSTNTTASQQQPSSSSVDFMSRVDTICKLRDECIIAERACADNPSNVTLRVNRDRLVQQLKDLTLGSHLSSDSA